MKTIQKLSLIVILSVTLCISYAQQDSLYGHLIDAETREPLIGGLAYHPSSNNGDFSDIDGNFFLPIDSRTEVIEFTYDGFRRLTSTPKDAYKIDALMRSYAYIYTYKDIKWYRWKERKIKKKEEKKETFNFKGILLDKNNKALAGVRITIAGKEDILTNANGEYEIETLDDVDGILIFYPSAYGDISIPLSEKPAVEAILID